MKDATRVYNVNITAGGTQLIPKAQVAAAGGDNMLPPIEITHGMPSLDLNLTPAQIKVVVAAFIILMAVAGCRLDQPVNNIFIPLTFSRLR